VQQLQSRNRLAARYAGQKQYLYLYGRGFLNPGYWASRGFFPGGIAGDRRNRVRRRRRFSDDGLPLFWEDQGAGLARALPIDEDPLG